MRSGFRHGLVTIKTRRSDARPDMSVNHQIRKPPLDQPPIIHITTMVHEVHTWESDSDYVDDDEQDELDQDPLMAIQDRVRPAELREMSVADICRTSCCPSPLGALWDVYLTPGRTYTRWSNRFESGVPER